LGKLRQNNYHQTDAEVVKQVQHLSIRSLVKNKTDNAMIKSQD
jgi:hypothetical protein